MEYIMDTETYLTIIWLISAVAAAGMLAWIVYLIVSFFIKKRRAQKEFQKLQEFNESVLTNSPVSIVVTNPDATVRFINPAFERLTGYKSEELLGQISPYSWILTCEYDNYVTNGNLSINSIQTLEEQLQKKSGEPFLTEVTIVPIIENDGMKYCLMNIVDITERKKFQTELLQAQKMDIVGRVTSGIAHDLGNFAGMICLTCGVMLQKFETDDPIRRHISDIIETGEMTTALTRQLLGFSKRSVLDVRILDLKELFSKLEGILRRVLREDIDLVITIPAKFSKIKADKVQIEQVIMNIITNAKDAMPYGGRVTIEAKNIEIEDDYMLSGGSVILPGNYVILRISDTGKGMSDEVKKHLFDMFYTTKGESGCGIGLSVVHRIIESIDGYIAIDSELGAGTTFSLYIPHILESSEKAQERISEDYYGNETILIVEDENSIRELITNTLREYGYKVFNARNGVEAFHIAEQLDTKIHLLLTDVVMPKMSGVELFEQFLDKYNNIKTIFISGYIDNIPDVDYLKGMGCRFLRKPFDIGDLMSEVRGIIG